MRVIVRMLNPLHHPGPGLVATPVRADIAPRVGLIVVIVLALLAVADDVHAQGVTSTASPSGWRGSTRA